jgi:hypothetical protein
MAVSLDNRSFRSCLFFLRLSSLRQPRASTVANVNNYVGNGCKP